MGETKMVIALHYDTFGIIKKSSCEPLNIPLTTSNDLEQQHYGEDYRRSKSKRRSR